MTQPRTPRRTMGAGRLAAVSVAALALALAGLQPAFATHPEVSLSGSNFEIDTDANLKVDDPVPSIDWASVTENRQSDEPTGATDDSFGQGTSEDSAVPTVVDGSIPPNKSDLLTFGTYLETSATGTKFLNLFWHRVQEPTGTTNMDFEFNQSRVMSANGVTPVRTAGDLLIQYDLSQGGSNPTLWISRWETVDKTKCEASNKVPCWDKKANLTAAGTATGSINTSTIPSAEADGLGTISPRTFGEASVNFSAIVPAGTCTSFGSAYLKSRSSDSFTSALKDFIKPTTVSITNCGSVKIIKTDDAGAALNGAEFTLYKNVAPLTSPRDPATDVVTSPVLKCTTAVDGTCTITNVLFGTYWVVETVVPSGYSAAADSAISVTNETLVQVTMVNPRLRGAILITKTAKHFGPGAPNLAADFVVKQGTTTVASVSTDATTGTVCVPNLLFGSYTVDETAGQAGYELDPSVETVVVDTAAANCTGSTHESVSFENKPLSNVTVSFTSQVTGGTAASIVCQAGSTLLGATPGDATPSATAYDDTSETFTNLVEGTYTCTIVIDP